MHAIVVIDWNRRLLRSRPGYSKCDRLAINRLVSVTTEVEAGQATSLTLAPQCRSSLHLRPAYIGRARTGRARAWTWTWPAVQCAMNRSSPSHSNTQIAKHTSVPGRHIHGLWQCPVVVSLGLRGDMDTVMLRGLLPEPSPAQQCHDVITPSHRCCSGLGETRRPR